MKGFHFYVFFIVFCTVLGCSIPIKELNWTLMSWNVQNLFDSKDDGSEYTEFDPGEGKWNERLYKRRLEKTGYIISKTVPGGADVVVLQELENPGVLEDLNKNHLKGLGYKWRVAIKGSGIICSGILSRYPIKNVRAIESGFWQKRALRPMVEASIQTRNGAITIIAVHWKSPWNGMRFTEGARIQEASVLKKRVLEILKKNPRAEIIVLGDLNTEGKGDINPAALAPFNPYEEKNAIILRTDKPEGAGFWKKKLVLFDPNPKQGPPGTYWFRNAWSRPDRALLTEGLLDSEGLQFYTIRVAASNLMGKSPEGQPRRWDSRLEEGYSDHLPLVLEFK